MGKKVFSFYTNRTIWTELDFCFSLYSTFGLIYVIDKISSGLSRIFNEPFITAIIVFTGLSAYGTIDRQSDVGRTTVEVFHALREDSSTALHEVWSSVKNSFISFYGTVTIAKLIQISAIGLLLRSVPDLLEFLIKTLSKAAKV